MTLLADRGQTVVDVVGGLRSRWAVVRVNLVPVSGCGRPCRALHYQETRWLSFTTTS